MITAAKALNSEIKYFALGLPGEVRHELPKRRRK